MNNKTMNTTYVEARNQMLNAIEKFTSMLNNEKDLLDAYESGDFARNNEGRNKKGEYVNIEQMKSNIAEMEQFIEKAQDALHSLTMQASIYM